MSDPLRELERDSLHQFVAGCSPLLRGRVLDYGCGLSPYREFVTGEYSGYDRPAFPGSVVPSDVDWRTAWSQPTNPLRRFYSAASGWDAILCTQVIQYVVDVPQLLEDFWQALAPAGALVLTGPTNWPVVEMEDLWRFTPAGITRLLEDSGFTVERVVERATVPSPGGPMLIGWGIVATP